MESAPRPLTQSSRKQLGVGATNFTSSFSITMATVAMVTASLITPRDLAVTIATVAMVIGCYGAWHHVLLITPRDLAVTIATVAMVIEKDDVKLVAPTPSCFRDD